MTRLCDLADVSSEAEIGLPAGKVDLKKWLHDFSTEDYRNAAKGHWAMAASVDQNRGSMTINVESIGGHLMVQNYRNTAIHPHFLKFISHRTDLWIFHIVHISMQVETELKIKPVNPSTCILKCRVSCRTKNPIIGIMARLALTPRFLKNHCIEETASFAADIYRKLNRRVSNPKGRCRVLS